jgi:hypothetical protein
VKKRLQKLERVPPRGFPRETHASTLGASLRRLKGSDRYGGNVNKLADAVLDYLWFLEFTDEEEANPDLLVKEFEGLLYQIENEFGDDEKAALKEAATRRLAQWLREPDEYGYTPRALLTLEQRCFLEDIAAGELWPMDDESLR